MPEFRGAYANLPAHRALASYQTRTHEQTQTLNPENQEARRNASIESRNVRTNARSQASAADYHNALSTGCSHTNTRRLDGSNDVVVRWHGWWVDYDERMSTRTGTNFSIWKHELNAPRAHVTRQIECVNIGIRHRTRVGAIKYMHARILCR